MAGVILLTWRDPGPGVTTADRVEALAMWIPGFLLVWFKVAFAGGSLLATIPSLTPVAVGVVLGTGFRPLLISPDLDVDRLAEADGSVQWRRTLGYVGGFVGVVVATLLLVQDVPW